MNKKYLAIALALAGFVASAPAFAGAVGTTGGSKTSSKVIDSVYEHTVVENRYVHDVKNIDITNTNTVTKNVSVQGADIVHTTTNTNWAAAVYDGQYSNATAAQNARAISKVEQGRNNCSTDNGKHTYGFAGTTYVDGNSVKGYGYRANDTVGYATYGTITGRSTTYTGSQLVSSSSSGKVSTGQTVETKSSKTTTDTKVDVTKDSYTTSVDSDGGTTVTDKLTSVKYVFSNDGIMVGDTDNFGNAYVAQGNVDQEKHYDRTITHTIINTVTDTDVITTTTTNTITTTNTTTKQNVYNQTVTNTYRDTYSTDVSVSVSPIVLDLDGDGRIEASNGNYLPHQGEFSKDAVLFDFYGNGFPVACEWVGANDGLLCRPNADGSVYGTNLFGTANGFSNGYDELSTLDTNKNGAIDGQELAGLMVWTDTNHNGIADKGELKSVESLGITSINVNHNKLASTFTRNGETFKTFDWCPTVAPLRKAQVANL